MPDARWKAFERWVAPLFGGHRRGPDTHEGKTDIVAEGYAVECKHLARPTFGVMAEAADQAARNADGPHQVPLAVIHRKRDSFDGSLVVMRLPEFLAWFGPKRSGDG